RDGYWQITPRAGRSQWQGICSVYLAGAEAYGLGVSSSKRRSSFMAVIEERTSRATRLDQVAEEVQYEQWKHWPVNWSALWVGALASVAALLIFGLIGVALGAYVLGPENRIVDWHKFSIGAL